MSVWLCCLLLLLLASLANCAASQQPLQKYDFARHTNNSGSFSAAVTTNPQNLTRQQAIIFQDVLIDSGGNYNSSTGQYTCPINATYVFHCTITTHTQKSNFTAELVKNGVVYMRIAAGNDLGLNQHVNMAIIPCTVGEVVQIRISIPEGTSVLVWGNRFTRFTGYILAPTVPEIESRHEVDIGAFYVTLQNPVSNLGHHQILLYDTAMYDPGREYSTTTGHYRCPFAGTYIFHITVTSPEQYTTDLTMELVHEGTPVMAVAAHNPYNLHNSGSNMCVLHCQSGDVVWVRAANENNQNVDISGGGFSTFSGFILHADPLMRSNVPAPMHETTIGSFFVSLSKNINVTQNGQAIIFDQVHHDPGTEYNVFTGHYRCPFNGTYVFHVNVGSGRQYVGPGDFHIARNGAAVGSTLPRNEYGFLNTGSSLTVFHCTAGDSVWVYASIYSYNYFEVSGILSTFSGFILHADIV